MKKGVKIKYKFLVIQFIYFFKKIELLLNIYFKLYNRILKRFKRNQNIMAQIDETQFYICGQHGNMLNHRGNVYSNLIPIKKIVYMEEKKKGPEFCNNCRTFGHWNGCLVLYCMNCEKREENQTDGLENDCGALAVGIERDPDSIHSATNTYLKNISCLKFYHSAEDSMIREIDWNQIGDKTLEDTFQIIHQQKENQMCYCKKKMLRDEDYDYSSEDSSINKEVEEAEDQETIEVFLNEEKWFEMKIQEEEEKVEIEEEKVEIEEEQIEEEQEDQQAYELETQTGIFDFHYNCQEEEEYIGFKLHNDYLCNDYI